jgi:hypothetical protein
VRQEGRIERNCAERYIPRKERKSDEGEEEVNDKGEK